MKPPTTAPALLSILAVLGLLTACKPTQLTAVTVVTGLNLPRGLTFDGSGNLLVAEAGIMRNGPSQYTNHSGRVLQVTPQHAVSVLVDELPFSFLPALGTGVGATDVAVVGDARYVLTGEGYDPLSRAVLRVVPGEPPMPVASILNFAARGLTSDLIHSAVVRANPYAMVAAPDGSALYVADGASGRVLRITLDGAITVFAELPNSPPLAGLTFGPDGRLYFTAFSALPHTPGSGAVWAVDSSGRLSQIVDQLTMPIDVGFDASGAMVVLEFGDGQPPQNPYSAGTGRLLRIESNGNRTTLLDHLNYPTAMIFSRAGDLYIAVNGAFTEPRQGAVLMLICDELGAAAMCPT